MYIYTHTYVYIYIYIYIYKHTHTYMYIYRCRPSTREPEAARGLARGARGWPPGIPADFLAGTPKQEGLQPTVSIVSYSIV